MLTTQSTLDYRKFAKKSRLLPLDRIEWLPSHLSGQGDSIQAGSQTRRALRAESPLRTCSPLSPGLALFFVCYAVRAYFLPGRTQSGNRRGG